MTATATRTRKPRQKPQRSATLGTSTSGKTILWLTQDGNLRAYTLTPLPSDFGMAFRLGKADNGDGHMEEYDVLIDGERSTCECKGFLHHRHCKHLESLNALIAAGKLAVPAPKQQPAPKSCPECGRQLRECTCFDDP